MDFSHIPVLLQETIDGLDIKENGIYVDGTAGGGGHSSEILKRLTTGKLISIDQDPDAIKAASQRLKDFQNVTIVRNNFSNIKEVLFELGVDSVDGVSHLRDAAGEDVVLLPQGAAQGERL